MALNVNGQQSKSWSIGILPPNFSDLTSSLKKEDVKIVESVVELLTGNITDLKGDNTNDKYRYIVDLIIKRITNSLNDRFGEFASKDNIEEYKEQILNTILNINVDSTTKIDSAYLCSELFKDVFEYFKTSCNDIKFKVLKCINDIDIKTFDNSVNKKEKNTNKIDKSEDITTTFKEDNKKEEEKFTIIKKNIKTIITFIVKKTKNGDDEVVDINKEDIYINDNDDNDNGINWTDETCAKLDEVLSSFVFIENMYYGVFNVAFDFLDKLQEFSDKVIKNIKVITSKLAPPKKFIKKKINEIKTNTKFIQKLNAMVSEFERSMNFLNTLYSFFDKNFTKIFVRISKEFFAFLLKLFIAIVIPIGLLVMLYWEVLKEPFLEMLGSVFDFISKTVNGVKNAIGKTIEEVVKPLMDYYMTEIHPSLVPFVDTVIDLATDVFNALVDEFANICNSFVRFGESTLEVFKNLFEGISDGMDIFMGGLIKLYEEVEIVIASLIVGFYKETDEIVVKICSLGSNIRQVVEDLFDSIKENMPQIEIMINDIKDDFFELVDKIMVGYTSQQDGLDEATKNFANSMDMCKKSIARFFEAFKPTQEVIKNVIQKLIDGMNTKKEEIVKGIEDFYNEVYKTIKLFMTGFQKYGAEVMEILQEVKTQATDLFENIGEKIWNKIKEGVKDVGRAVWRFFTESDEEKKKRKEQEAKEAETDWDRVHYSFSEFDAANKALEEFKEHYDWFSGVFESIYNCTNEIYLSVKNIGELLFGSTIDNLEEINEDGTFKDGFGIDLIYNKFMYIRENLIRYKLHDYFDYLTGLITNDCDPKIALKVFEREHRAMNQVEKQMRRTEQVKKIDDKEQTSIIKEYIKSVNSKIGRYHKFSNSLIGYVSTKSEEIEKTVREKMDKKYETTFIPSNIYQNMASMETA